MNAKQVFAAGLLVACSLALPLPAFSAPQAQKDTQRTATSASEFLSFAGIVAEKGAVLRCEADQKVYKILNSETLRHLEGQYVAIKARFLAEKGVYYVTAVRASHDAAEPIVLSDVAFRR
jgi:hypothetical protein